jgi:hypothetical protein
VGSVAPARNRWWSGAWRKCSQNQGCQSKQKIKLEAQIKLEIKSKNEIYIWHLESPEQLAALA